MEQEIPGFGLNRVEVEPGWTHLNGLSNDRRHLKGWRKKGFVAFRVEEGVCRCTQLRVPRNPPSSPSFSPPIPPASTPWSSITSLPCQISSQPKNPTPTKPQFVHSPSIFSPSSMPSYPSSQNGSPRSPSLTTSSPSSSYSVFTSSASIAWTLSLLSWLPSPSPLSSSDFA